MGGTWNAFLQGIWNPKEYMGTMWLQAEAMLAKAKGLPLPAKFVEGQRAGAFGRGVYSLETSPGMVKQLEAVLKSRSERALKALWVPGLWKRGGQAMTEFIENNLRGTVYRHFRKRGWAPRNAAMKVIESQFSYDPEMYTHAVNWTRSNLIPFFNWTFNNVPYQLRKMVEQPGKFAVLGKLAAESEQASGETPVEKEYRRDYMKGLGAIAIPEALKPAAKTFLETFEKVNPFAALSRRLPGIGPALKRWEASGFAHDGAIYINPNFPFQDLIRLSRGVKGSSREFVSMLNPILKWSVEAYTKLSSGYSLDFYTGRRLSPGSMDVAPTWMQALDKTMGGYPPIQRLWDVLGAERDIKLGVLKIAPERLKALQLVVPPMTLVQRAVPSDPVTEQYYAERGRLYDQWLTGQLSNWLGVKFILPAVEERRRRA